MVNFCERDNEPVGYIGHWFFFTFHITLRDSRKILKHGVNELWYSAIKSKI